MSKSKVNVYTSGRWTAKPGNEKDFVKTWKEFANWTLKHQDGVIDALLLEEADDPLRFISFGSWRDQESVAEWRQTEGFKKYVAKLKVLCDEIQIRTMKSVVTVGAR